MANSLLHIIIVLIVLGLVCWLVTFIPIPHPFGMLIQIIITITAIIYVLKYIQGLV